MSTCVRSRALAMLITAACSLSLPLPAPGAAAVTSVLKGVVRDVDGKPVEGASVYAYATDNTRRPPDFLSPPSDREGRYAVTLPSGRYWVVARAGKEHTTGPLLSDGKHSGDPAVIDVSPDRNVERDFTVVALREAARKSSRMRADVITVSGRIVDPGGTPVKGACALLYRDREVHDLPDYVSAWTDDVGRYALSVPPGAYCVGAAIDVPLVFREGSCRRTVFTSSTSTADIVLPAGRGK